MLRVVGKQPARKLEQLLDPGIGGAVENGRVLAPCGDEAAPPQTRKVIRHLRLRLAQPRDELPNRKLLMLRKQVEDPNTSGIAQAAEVLRH